MTIQGAISELQNLLDADDIPFYYKGGIEKVIETITIDAEPVRHGEWIEQEDDYHHYWECSECGMGVGLDDIRHFCPNCGAKMDKE